MRKRGLFVVGMISSALSFLITPVLAFYPGGTKLAPAVSPVAVVVTVVIFMTGTAIVLLRWAAKRGRSKATERR